MKNQTTRLKKFMEKDNKNGEIPKKIKVEDEEGLTVSYDKEELDDRFPHLIKELSEKTKSLRINAIDNENQQNNKEELQDSSKLYPTELYNPTAIDFIRRCTKKEEATIILDYLLKRDEITQEDYSKTKNIISQEGGLKRFIDESGGLKRPGYYMRKYYKRDIKNQKINTKKD